MKLDEKLYKHMVMLGLTQQALADKARVSDSEVSRLLNGQSKRPGLYNLHRLAQALGVSLDYLADDELDSDPHAPPEPLSKEDREILELSNAIGQRHTLMILDAVRVLGFELAIRRLYGMESRPSSEIGDRTASFSPDNANGA